jgi:hypothetical protein
MISERFVVKTVTSTLLRGSNWCRNVVSYESDDRELEIRLMNEGRYDERLKVRVEKSTMVCLLYNLLLFIMNQ